MKKRTATALAAVTAAALGAGLGTFASFGDVESAEAQSVTAGTLDLGIAGVGTAGFDIGPGKAGGPMRPGAPSRKQVFKLVNSGSVPGSVTLSMVGLTDQDNGCTDAEEDAEKARYAGSMTCGDGPTDGELSTPMIMSVLYAAVPAGQACPAVPQAESTYRSHATDRRKVPAAQARLEGDSVRGVPGRGVFDLGGVEVSRAQDLCVLARVNLPRNATNLVQSDRTTFDLRFDLTQS